MTTHGELVGPFPDGTDPDSYDRLRRRVLWQLPMGLYLLGTSAGDRKNLMTLNWAMQVSMRPKQIAVSIEHAAVTFGLLRDGGVFSLSILARVDRAVVRKFVKPAEHDELARTLGELSYDIAVTGAPIPRIALSWLDCEVRQCLDAGSHSVFVGEVVGAGTRDDGTGSDGASAPAAPPEILRMEDTRMSYGG
ncbi:MAG: flavin reductase family protein [Acidimicrobiales bacterium]